MTQGKWLAIVLPGLLLGACVVQDRGGPPAAEVTVPGVAFGYTDGYWDTGHQWHAWGNPQEAEAWHAHNPGHYYDRPHDREANGGWHDDDQWWGHH